MHVRDGSLACFIYLRVVFFFTRNRRDNFFFSITRENAGHLHLEGKGGGGGGKTGEMCFFSFLFFFAFSKLYHLSLPPPLFFSVVHGSERSANSFARGRLTFAQPAEHN